MLGDELTVARATRAAWENLVYPWGVASLAASDPFFHPYHLAWAHYHKDEAYHNGTVWLWNNGIAMQRMIELGQAEPAWTLFANMNRQTLERGVVGGMAENMDAWPHPGEDWPRLTGTYLQAWSNSEQLRVWYQYFLGVRPDLVAGEIVLAPRLPPTVGPVDFNARVGSGSLRGVYLPGAAKASYAWECSGSPFRLVIELPGFEPLHLEVGEGDRVDVEVSGSELSWRLSAPSGEVLARGSARPDTAALEAQAGIDTIMDGVGFARHGDAEQIEALDGDPSRHHHP